MTATLDERRALEALRSGVPSAAAIRTVGCEQPSIEARFRAGLGAIAERSLLSRQEAGLVVRGDFGSGKSHLLGYLAQLALEEGFVCSKVVISKETPLNDAGKVFRAAMEAAELPGVRGVALEEVDTQLQQRKDGAGYAGLYEWAVEENSGLWPGFPASLKIWENPPDDVERSILDFWGGQPVTVAKLRGWLQRRNLQSAFSVPARPKAGELQPQHAQFASRLFQAAGYRGWVILLDEVELIGRYSRLQRARSYSELGRWLGLSPSAPIPGVFTIAAITDDFSTRILDEVQDRELAADLLRERGEDAAGARAELGMRAIDNGISLRMPGKDTLKAIHDRLRDLHGRAYGWEPHAIEVGSVDLTARMRSYVRRWVTEWDLARFRPDEAHTVAAVELPATNFSEDDDLAADSS